MKTITQSHLKYARPLLFGIGIVLSFNVLAKDFATQKELDAESAIRESGDNDLRNQIAVINQLLPSPHVVGERYQGGIIFYVDDTGQHGLIAALADQGQQFNKWSNGVSRVTGASGDGIGAGRMNTPLAIANQIGDSGVRIFATKLAADYRVQDDGENPCTGSATETCWGDWYLPSKNELNLMWFNLADSDHNGRNDGQDDPNNLAGFGTHIYWSSTEVDFVRASSQSFSDGLVDSEVKANTWGVRAIRAF